jgi:2-aminoadipate transaminase
MPTDTLPASRLSRRRDWASEQAIGFRMQQAVENRDCVSLAAGLVDPLTLPVDLTRETVTELLAEDATGREALQYGTTPGAEAVRRTLLGHLARLEGTTPADLPCDVDRLVVATGSAQLLSILSEMLFDPGDVCLVAAPTYFAYLGTLNGVGARVVAVETDENGMRPEALAATLDRLAGRGELDRVKLIYLVSYFENPSGVSLSVDRRERIVAIAREFSREHRIHVLEDAAYRELSYDGDQVPSVWSFDQSDGAGQGAEAGETVILAQTFSKSFSPGLRVGFGVLPRSLVRAVVDRKGNEDFGSSNFTQRLLARVIESGRYEAHVARLRTAYRAKRDAMLAACDRHLAGLPGVTWLRPKGGLYVWLQLPEHVDTGFDSPLFRRAAEVDRVMYVPGELCYPNDPGGTSPHRRHECRLSFGVQDAAGIEEGIARLGRAITAVLPTRSRDRDR